MSMIGQTLRGHRSMGALLRADQEAEVLVGLSAFQQIGRHRDTPVIAMELYLEAFKAALEEEAYNFEEIITAIAAEWENEHAAREDTAFGMLADTVMPLAGDHEGRLQSSKTYQEATAPPEAMGEVPTPSEEEG